MPYPAMPPSVAANELIESSWGNKVVDAFPRMGIRTTPKSDERLLILGNSIVATTDGNGDVLVVFGELFRTGQVPAVWASPGDIAANHTMTVHSVGVGGFTVRARVAHTGDVLAFATSAFHWGAVGYRT